MNPGSAHFGSAAKLHFYNAVHMGIATMIRPFNQNDHRPRRSISAEDIGTDMLQTMNRSFSVASG